jgi:hypothetical protein
LYINSFQFVSIRKEHKVRSGVNSLRQHKCVFDSFAFLYRVRICTK